MEYTSPFHEEPFEEHFNFKPGLNIHFKVRELYQPRTRNNNS